MRWAKMLVIGAMAVGLGGCYGDQTRQEATCELEVDRYLEIHRLPEVVDLFEHADQIQLCMRSKGYKPIYGPPCPIKNEPGKRDLLQTSEWLRSREPLCYAPTAWWSRQAFRAEVWTLRQINAL
jgi:hypothetical protein